jgi:HD-GYP domain-containing protein (c-di-GMP phosphodiesterase class II)
MGVALARQLNLPYGKMVDLAIGLLLHDIGKLALPDALRDPNRTLTEDEEYEYQRHTSGGFGLLKDMGQTFGATSKIVALQHHEHWDGSGYPKKLKGNAIHEFAQICAVVDTYDRLTTSRKYGRQALPHEALEYLMGSCGTKFKLSVVQAFLEIVAPFPIGSTVSLSGGEKGVVVEVEAKLPQRPVVRLQGSDPLPIRLADHPSRVVTGVEAY